MKQYAPLIVVIVAIVTAVLTILGDESYSKLIELRGAIARQREKNDVLRSRVEDLRSRVDGIQLNDRMLEKAARNELGMARPDEMIFLFEDSRKR